MSETTVTRRPLRLLNVGKWDRPGGGAWERAGGWSPRSTPTPRSSGSISGTKEFEEAEKEHKAKKSKEAEAKKGGSDKRKRDAEGKFA